MAILCAEASQLSCCECAMRMHATASMACTMFHHANLVCTPAPVLLTQTATQSCRAPVLTSLPQTPTIDAGP